jgi:hypothetical protein
MAMNRIPGDRPSTPSPSPPRPAGGQQARRVSGETRRAPGDARRVSGDTQGVAEDTELSETAALTDPVKRPGQAGQTEFEEALLNIASERAPDFQVRSPRQCIADFVMPQISSPALFQGGRSLMILQRLKKRIATLDENEELLTLACDVIDDEIERHIELSTCLLSVIGQ